MLDFAGCNVLYLINENLICLACPVCNFSMEESSKTLVKYLCDNLMSLVVLQS